jgi:N-acetylmuramoyl-L-alanine amidase
MRGIATVFVLMNMVLVGFSTSATASTLGLAAMNINTVAFNAMSLTATRPRVKSWNVPRTEALCMTAALYHEARGETVTGQLAVARVILNRSRSKVYPDSVCGVVYQNAERLNRCQFSFACDTLSDYPKNARSYRRVAALARAVLYERATERLRPVDPREYRNGDFDLITHYHTDRVNPSWGAKINRIGQIGNHIFYRSDRVARSL